MRYRELTEEQYQERLRLVIAGTEGLHARAQDVGDGKATIGWGYTFNRSDNARIWADSGITLNDRERRQLQAIDAAPSGQRTRLGLAFTRELTAAEADSLLRASMRDYERPAARLGMPLSDERIALTSVAYNRGPGALLGSDTRPEHPVMDAIREGDRAEAWYQIRYNCWGTNTDAEAGLRKRRFAEAQVFGLYDDPANVGPDEARNVLAMHDRHREEIDRVERRFGDSLHEAPARLNRIAQANRDYPALVHVYGEVPTLESALAPANHVVSRAATRPPPHDAARAADLRVDRRSPDSSVPPPATSPDAGSAPTVDPLLRQSRDAVRNLDQALGRTYDDASERMAASLAYLGRTNGFERIDRVVLNVPTESLQEGENVFIVQGGLSDATNRVAHMKTQHALAAPAEESMARLARFAHDPVQHRDMPEPDPPSRAPPHRITV